MATREEILTTLLARRRGTQGAYSPENIEVAQSIRRGLARAGEEVPENEGTGGGGILGGGLSVLGRAFDVLSRPLYAVTNVIEDVQDTGDLSGALGQVWQGLSGQDKVTGSDLIKNTMTDEEIEENKFMQGAGGFALDVLLDPLSYVGVGVAKKLGEETIQAGAAKVAASYVNDADLPGTAARIAQYSAEKEARRGFLQQGFSLTEANAGAKTVGKEFTRDQALEAARVAMPSIREGNEGKVFLKLLGQETRFGSRGLYGAGRKTADVVKTTSAGRAINKAFRPAATFIGRTHSDKRITEAVGMAQLERDAKAVAEGGITRVGGVNFDEGLRTLNDDEAIEITGALEDMETPYKGAFQSQIKSARELVRGIGRGEEGAMIDPSRPLREEDTLIDNFVHHSFDMSVDNPAEVAQWHQARKKEISTVLKAAKEESIKQADIDSKNWLKTQIENGADVESPELIDDFNSMRERLANEYFEATPKRTTYTTKRAAAEGLHPVRDVRHILGNHLQDYYRQTSRLAFTNGIVNEFGVDLGESAAARATANKLGMVKAPSKYVGENVYVPREIGKVMSEVEKVFYTDEAAGAGLLKLYDQGLGWLKVGQTVINPGFHIRNALSDMTLNYLDGVVNPAVYGESWAIGRALKKGDDITGEFSPLADPANPADDINVTLDDIKIEVGKTELTGREVEDLFVGSGSKSGFYRTEIMVGKGKTIERLRNFSEAREDWARRAHFIDALKKEAKDLDPSSSSYYRDLEAAARKAGERVRKFNIDYGDLTPFEQRVMKRVVPFYTWMRKNIPLQIETLLMRPGRQMVIPKAIRNLQVMMGQSPDDTDILGLNYLPDYMRKAMYTSLIGEGTGQNGVYWNPGTIAPVMDLNEFFGEGTPRDIAERQLSGLTPFAQVPIQQITGYNFFSGRPQNKGILQNILETTPGGRYGYGISQGDSPQSTRLLNLLTGAGLISLNEGMQQGELRRQEDVVQRLLRERQGQGAGGT